MSRLERDRFSSSNTLGCVTWSDKKRHVTPYIRDSSLQVCHKIFVLKNLANATLKHLWWDSIFGKVTGWSLQLFWKVWEALLKNASGWLFLVVEALGPETSYFLQIHVPLKVVEIIIFLICNGRLTLSWRRPLSCRNQSWKG